jgi:hypothetical protein
MPPIPITEHGLSERAREKAHHSLGKFPPTGAGSANGQERAFPHAHQSIINLVVYSAMGKENRAALAIGSRAAPAARGAWACVFAQTRARQAHATSTMHGIPHVSPQRRPKNQGQMRRIRQSSSMRRTSQRAPAPVTTSAGPATAMGAPKETPWPWRGGGGGGGGALPENLWAHHGPLPCAAQKKLMRIPNSLACAPSRVVSNSR